jgi:4-amino-4-deoxy-L-arabinose transferase-like glycosyltransferase
MPDVALKSRPANVTAARPPPRRRPTWWSWKSAAAIAIFALAAALRLWSLRSRPGFDWDEPVYTSVATSLAHGQGLYVKPSYGVVREPYLFHPPFYFFALAGWFKVFGAGIVQARVLSALASLASLGILARLVQRRWGTLALPLLAVLGTDGWLVFTNRVSWIENVMFVLIAAGMLAYDSGLRRDSYRRFVLGALLLGFAAVFKQVGAYALLAVVIHWWLTKAQPQWHRRFLVMVAGIAGCYVLVLIVTTQHGGHNAFLDDTWVQLQRIAGQKSARGSINSGAVAGALLGPYKVFFGTLILSGLSMALVAWRTLQVLRARGSSARITDPLLFSWALAATITFGALKLKMAHYFMMIEIPLLLFLASEAVEWVRRGGERRRARVRLVVLACGLIVCANLATFDLRFASRHDNALAAVTSYMGQTAPPQALVATEESVGTIIPRPYCKFSQIGLCYDRIRYLIVYRSRTQAPPDNPLLNGLLRVARPLATFEGFKERITVYESPGTGPVCAQDRVLRGFCDPHLYVPLRTEPLRRSHNRVRLRVGTYPDLVLRPATPVLTPLPTAAAPAVLLVGTTADDRSVFWNIGGARVSGGGQCKPSRDECREIWLRARESVHLEVPTVSRRHVGYELKVDGFRTVRAGHVESPTGRTLIRRLATAARRASPALPTSLVRIGGEHHGRGQQP